MATDMTPVKQVTMATDMTPVKLHSEGVGTDAVENQEVGVSTTPVQMTDCETTTMPIKTKDAAMRTEQVDQVRIHSLLLCVETSDPSLAGSNCKNYWFYWTQCLVKCK